MTKYFEINRDGHNVRCKLYVNRMEAMKKVVLFCHGFAGHKDNSAAEKFAGRVLSKFGDAAVLTFNLPCHGDDVKKKLVLRDCLDYLGIVLDHIRESFHVEEIYAYATSFGGYLVLSYLHERGNPFRKIALRCPAVNMYTSLTETIMGADELALLRKGKSVPVGFDRKIDVNPQFLEDLRNADIQKLSFLDYADDILILHGTADEVIPFEASQKFADDNVIEFIPVEGADHRFQKPAHMELATKAVIAFFGF